MTSIAALVAGLTTSIHCIGMCGPLACSVTSRCKSKQHAQLESLSYHSGRLFSYTLIGALAGAIGYQPLSWFFDSPAVILPWLMVVFLIVSAFPQVFKIPRLNRLTLPYYKAKKWAESKPPGIMGAMLGLISPCLPCTPLYLIFGVSLLSGTPLSGARIAFCFALGTIPLLWLAQSSSHLLVRWIPMKWRNPLRTIILLGISVLLIIRLQGTLPMVRDQFTSAPSTELEGSSTTSAESSKTPEKSEPVEATDSEKTPEKPLPSCCH